MGKDLVQKAEDYAKTYPDCQEVAKQSWLAGYDAGKEVNLVKRNLIYHLSRQIFYLLSKGG